ncbi:MAG: class E sortase [Patescibacteria group bacterium]
MKLPKNKKHHQIIKSVILGVELLIVLFVILNFQYIDTVTEYKAEQSPNVVGAEMIEESKITLEPNELFIPSLDIRAPIVFIDEKNETVFQLATREGVVHYPDTALVGEVGNAYIFGHSSDLAWVKNPYRNIFALLPEIKTDACIFTTDDRGKIYSYQVEETYIVSPKDLRVLDQETNGEAILTVQTSYPLGTALARYIVKSKLSDEANCPM